MSQVEVQAACEADMSKFKGYVCARLRRLPKELEGQIGVRPWPEEVHVPAAEAPEGLLLRHFYIALYQRPGSTTTRLNLTDTVAAFTRLVCATSKGWQQG